MSDFPDVMVDLETTGTNFDRTGILQISAIRFNLKERTIDAANIFDGYMALPPWRFWDESTRTWWHDPARFDRLCEMYKQFRDPATVLAEYRDWFHADQPRFYCKRQFDFAFVASYCKDFNIANQSHFRDAIEMEAFIAGMFFPGVPPKPTVEFQGRAHDAVYDALFQIRCLFEACDVAKGGVLVG